MPITRNTENVLVNDASGRAVPFVLTAGITLAAASDTLTYTPGILYVGTGGDVAVRTVDNCDLVFVGVPSGTFMPVLVTMVLATGTVGAADFLILY